MSNELRDLREELNHLRRENVLRRSSLARAEESRRDELRLEQERRGRDLVRSARRRSGLHSDRGGPISVTNRIGGSSHEPSTSSGYAMTGFVRERPGEYARRSFSRTVPGSAGRPYLRGQSTARGEAVGRILGRHQPGLLSGDGGPDPDPDRRERLAAVTRHLSQRQRPASRSPVGRGRAGLLRELQDSPGSEEDIRSRSRPRLPVDYLDESRFLPSAEHTLYRRRVRYREEVVGSASEEFKRTLYRESHARSSATVFLRDRGLTSSPEAGEQLVKEFKKLRMTGAGICRFPICFRLSRQHLIERWQNNWVIPGNLLRRMFCGHCSTHYIFFGFGGELSDR